jgi:branched-chain amino acid transport system ATP-binding protein
MAALSRAYLSTPSVALVDQASFGLWPAMVDQVFSTLRDPAATGVALLGSEALAGPGLGCLRCQRQPKTDQLAVACASRI